ncbi:transcription factor MYB1R1 [Nicotiana tabacum]|uniref:Transcription factor MYB1R1 n=1 Tax=Nicotiana tabacum TaxID=4097 RepID=A0A1S3WXB3_TOBAC|nr:transcription factor MYB1R1-like isoform X2 [Nicotiana tomentosiformis]XP_016432254.1 PREDICTED: transcription factor MYB1R1-like [Nicotiana tabacum]
MSNDCGNKEHELQSKGFMLFGVRVIEGGTCFRKSASMNNLVLFEQQQQDSNVAAGYASDDVVHPSARSRERKRGVPWTEEEHKLFLLGLQKVGKGDWRGISRNFVKTRTPTQVASHAQKYFLRRNNTNNRRRRRSSLFDITTHTVQTVAKLEDKQMNQNTIEKFPMSAFEQAKLSGNCESSTNNLMIGLNKSVKPIRSIPFLPVPPSSKMENLNLNKTYDQESSPLSLKLSTSTSSSDEKSPPARHSSGFQAMSSGFNGNTSGDSIISVA